MLRMITRLLMRKGLNQLLGRALGRKNARNARTAQRAVRIARKMGR